MFLNQQQNSMTYTDIPGKQEPQLRSISWYLATEMENYTTLIATASQKVSFFDLRQPTDSTNTMNW